MSGPKPPDPIKTAEAQSGMNRETAITQYGLAATNQKTPQGSLSYEQIGTWPDGTPRYEATQTYSPEQQALYDQYTGLAGKLGGIGNTQAGKVEETLGTPFDFDTSTANELIEMQRQFLDPQWSEQQTGMESDLFNRGVRPGSEAYDNAMRDFSTNRQRAYDQNYLTSYNAAKDTALTERNQPLKELMALLSGTQPQQPSYTTTPSPGVAPTDYTGLVNNNYTQQVGQHNAMMGGLFGLASAPLGGWAKGGFPMPFG